MADTYNTENFLAVASQKHQDMILQLSRKQKNLIKDYNNCHFEVCALELKWTTINNKIASKETQQQELLRLQSNQLDKFGNEMIQLVQMVKENKDLFVKAPKGPLGTCFSVRSASWIPLIERIFFPFLFVFIVDNRKDYNALLNMIDMIYGKYYTSSQLAAGVPKKPDVWITRFTGIKKNLSEERVPYGMGYTALLDMLEIHGNDADIFNVLHYFTNFEKVLLFNNEHEAFYKMAEPYRLPKNSKIGYTREFMKIFPCPCFRTISLHYPTVPYGTSREYCIGKNKTLQGRLKQLQYGTTLSSSKLSEPFDFTSKTELLNLNFKEQGSNSQSEFHLIPYAKNATRQIQAEIQDLKTILGIHRMIVKRKRADRLNLYSNLELITKQLKEAKKKSLSMMIKTITFPENSKTKGMSPMRFNETCTPKSRKNKSLKSLRVFTV